MSLKRVRIDSFCDTGAGGTPSRGEADRYFGGDIPWVKSGELREDTILATEEHITQAGLDESSAKIVPAGALLVALYGATVGRIATLGIDAATNQAVCHIVPRGPNVDRRFLFYSLRTCIPGWLSRRVGGAQPNISQQIIKETEIPLPPLPEQRRIAEVLDRADALRLKRRAALAHLDTLTQAIFVEMFGAQNGCANHPTRTLADCAAVVSGVTKGRKLSGRGVTEVSYLRVANVQAGFLDLSEIKTIVALPAEVEELRLQAGDVVMTEGGDFDKLGRGALWEGQIADCIHQNHVFRVRTDPAQLLPRFFHDYLQTEPAKAYFLRCAKRTTNLASINMTQLRALPVPLPPLPLQQEFARRVTAVEQLRSAHRKSLAQLDELFTSLQHRAFRGEL